LAQQRFRAAPNQQSSPILDDYAPHTDHGPFRVSLCHSLLSFALAVGLHFKPAIES